MERFIDIVLSVAPAHHPAYLWFPALCSATGCGRVRNQSRRAEDSRAET